MPMQIIYELSIGNERLEVGDPYSVHIAWRTASPAMVLTLLHALHSCLTLRHASLRSAALLVCRERTQRCGSTF